MTIKKLMERNDLIWNPKLERFKFDRKRVEQFHLVKDSDMVFKDSCIDLFRPQDRNKNGTPPFTGTCF